MRRIIWWLRRDFRLHDNSALTAALHDGEAVIPLFVLDNQLLRSERTQGYRLAWLLDALREMKAALREHGADLLIRRGDALTELLRVAREADADALYFNRDYSPYAEKRDQSVITALAENGITAKTFKDAVIHEADEVHSAAGKQYEVYTPYRRAWSLLPKPDPLPTPTPEMLRQLTTADLSNLPIPTTHELGVRAAPAPICEAGEKKALRRLDYFVEGLIGAYSETRDLPAHDGTSILSPYLRWGMISPRTCYQSAMEALAATNKQEQRNSINVWIGELIWREFNYQILMTTPRIVNQSFRELYDGIEWQSDPAQLEAWQQGRTGYPIVDAAMRQLNATGWMHNRTRMIVASFLCKDLLIDWREGERYFMQRLLDGDVANNVGNWQWVAGTGTDAAPYFRIFNPTTQGQKFDPKGEYIRRWLPELRDVPDKFVHAPEKLSAVEQQTYGCVIGQDYPAPIVDHAVQRELALQMYGQARGKG
ncbi:MAG: deoxyribodipyrimidine photo-lyase [Anaerolineae bacterium]|nr:deoxyribodipyrimidine photo-lyase [Anaerolineae bacterium]